MRMGENRIIEVVVSKGENTGVMIDVTNQSKGDAEILLRKLSREFDLDLVIDIADEYQMFSNEITEGFVVKTEPAEGETLKPGDTVRVYISKGPELETFPVPRFIGQPIETVREQLKTTWKLTCTDQDIELVDSEQPAGIILWQSIPETTEATEGDTIKFKVSSGLSTQTMTVTQTYDLPQDGRDHVEVRVLVDGEEQFYETVWTSDETVRVKLTGSGTLPVQVYFDGQLTETYDLQFS